MSAASLAARAVVYESPRLRMRPLVDEDAPFILELLNDPAWLRYVGDRGVRTLGDARRYIEQGPRRMYAEHGFGPYLVERKDDGASLGICGLFRRDTLPDVDVGFALAEHFRGRGYAYEAAAATLRYAREVLKLGRVVAIAQRRGLPRYTDKTITTLPALNAELARVRERGWAADDEEHSLGMRCVASVLRDEHGEAIAAIAERSLEIDNSSLPLLHDLVELGVEELALRRHVHRHDRHAGGADRREDEQRGADIRGDLAALQQFQLLRGRLLRGGHIGSFSRYNASSCRA